MYSIQTHKEMVIVNREYKYKTYIMKPLIMLPIRQKLHRRQAQKQVVS